MKTHASARANNARIWREWQLHTCGVTRDAPALFEQKWEVWKRVSNLRFHRFEVTSMLLVNLANGRIFSSFLSTNCCCLDSLFPILGAKYLFSSKTKKINKPLRLTPCDKWTIVHYLANRLLTRRSPHFFFRNCLAFVFVLTDWSVVWNITWQSLLIVIGEI